MKNLIAILAFVLTSQAQAQIGQLNNQGYQGEVLVPVQNVQPVQESSAQANPQTASGNQIYILNTQRTNAQARQGQVQEQPVTVVQEAPLKASAGEQFRNRRKNEESATEDGIVQALERARLDDEVKRRDKFNNAIGANQANGSTIVGDNNSVSQTQVIQQPAVQAQVVPVQPVRPVVEVVPVPVATPKQRIHVISETVTDDGPDIAQDDERYERRRNRRDDRRDDSVTNELRAAFSERREDRQSYYVGALATFGNYDNVINVNRSMGYGIVVGTQTTERIVAEGSFTYAKYQLEDVYNSYGGGIGNCCSNLVVDMKQMNFAAAAKYVFLPGKFRPAAGAALSYTRRTYSYYDNDFRTSDALDAGAVVGADLQLTEGFAIGVDFRYFTNLGYRQNTNRQQSFVYAQQRNDPETLDYYMVNLVGKFTF